jgi:hypothetical protein
MAKRKSPALTLDPFPTLKWDRFFWTGTIKLPAWKGFQNRLGAYAARVAKKKSDGTCRLSIDVAEPQATPSAEQAEAFRFLIANQEAVRDAILQAVFDEYPFEYQSRYLELRGPTEPGLPDLEQPEQLKTLLGLSSVLIHPTARDGIAYVGYDFGCAWDEEHGEGVMMHRDRVVGIGYADVAIDEWVAKHDAKPKKKAVKKKTAKKLSRRKSAKKK